MSKHIINKKEDWASESLQGYLHLNNEHLFALKEYPNVVVRKDYANLKEGDGKVALISGGGAGHEPAHVGYVGSGMLTAVVCGNLFASPSTLAIQSAIRLVGESNKAGVLLIVKNYTGDRLNFGIAASRAKLEGIKVEWVLVDDDVALLNDDNRKDNTVGERGLCGTVFIHKIAGALAQKGKSLYEIKEKLDYILRNNLLRTLGVSLSGRVQLPGETDKEVTNSNQIELGLGIHGEAGKRKMDLLKSYEFITLMFEEYLLTKQTNNQNICLMVNNLGGLSNLEMYLLINDCYKYFTTNQPACVIKRVYCDSFMTSLSMSGFSLTLLILDNSDVDFTLSLLDAKTKAPSWPRSLNKDLQALEYVSTDLKPETIKLDENKYISFEDNEDLKNLFEATLKQISLDLIKYTDLLNKLDSECGDGDCGSSLAKIAENILKDIDASKFDFNFPHQVISHLSNILENGGGSLCIILSLFASAAAKAFNVESIDGVTKYGDKLYWIRIWKNFVDYGLNDVCEYGKAKPNQRSIVDPLNQIKIYLNDFLAANPGDSVKFNINDFLKELVEVTEKSVNLTAKMRPRVGRASYVDVNIINSPDAGATGILTIINSIDHCLRNN